MTGNSELLELADWLQSESDKRTTIARGRRDAAKSMRGATAKELKSAHKLAEKMSGHPIHHVSTSVASAKHYADSQDRIAEKIERNAKRLATWAKLVRLSAESRTPVPEEK